MYSMIINQYTLHLEISLFAIFPDLELDERVLETVTCLFVPDDFAGEYFTEPAEDEIKVFVCHHR